MTESSDRVLVVHDDIFDEHDWPGHPENARRLQAIAEVARRITALAGTLGAAGSVWVLEGGYDLEALPASVAATLEVLAVA